MSSSRLPDRYLKCHLCGESFVFSAGEQELQRVRGIENVPARCPRCRRRPLTLPYPVHANSAH